MTGGDGSRAIHEYLDALKEDGSSISPAKKVSQTDPMARWTAAHRVDLRTTRTPPTTWWTLRSGLSPMLRRHRHYRTSEVWSTKVMIERGQGSLRYRDQEVNR